MRYETIARGNGDDDDTMMKMAMRDAMLMKMFNPGVPKFNQ